MSGHIAVTHRRHARLSRTLPCAFKANCGEHMRRRVSDEADPHQVELVVVLNAVMTQYEFGSCDAETSYADSGARAGLGRDRASGVGLGVDVALTVAVACSP